MSEPKKSLLQDMIEGMAASKNRQQSPGMSQERTEQRDPVADVAMVEAIEKRAADIRHRIEQNPRIKDTNCAILATNKMLGELELGAALRYWIKNSESWSERYDARTATAAEFADDANKAEAEIDRLNAVIAGQAEAIREQTAKVQDRDAEIIRQRERTDRLDSELHKQNCRNQDQAEEIERLRAAMELTRIQFAEIREKEKDPVLAALIDWAISGINLALKGAE